MSTDVNIQVGDAVVVDHFFRAYVTHASHYGDDHTPVFMLNFADGRNTGGGWYFPHQLQVVPLIELLAELGSDTPPSMYAHVR